MDPLDTYPTTLRTHLKEECVVVHSTLVDMGLPNDGPTNYRVRMALHQLVLKALNHNLDYRESQE